MLLRIYLYYIILVIVRCAETGLVPLFGPSCGKLTSVPGATVAELSVLSKKLEL